jgi:hypothetical protein
MKMARVLMIHIGANKALRRSVVVTIAAMRHFCPAVNPRFSRNAAM